ncbi:MarR family winged helix-turn-helix transcriptional regulator [Actinomadura rupiterrae]|uniref:MarR family winged helix-turn-helix transcriptional regulator n=1 Tax=Actinomadura rupiterrae TaxID=559627 RepID=UPI0020A571A5|nr:MarR family transcriptional regulator [Actinomadura rupiterrae]MCP2339530.1 DNA-binding MarR family transcriptional regulator [Actinomadura rupiterrae]
MGPRDDGHGRDDALETIRWELTALARRARAVAGRTHPDLSLVAYSLLSHLNESGGCRAVDLADYFLLDKSTVSRQVAALERLGLVERHPDPAHARGQRLAPTEAGRELLDEAVQRRHEAITERLRDWSDGDLDRFARYLVRYNAAEE